MPAISGLYFKETSTEPKAGRTFKFFTDVSYRARFRGALVIAFASQMSATIASVLLFLLLSAVLPLALGWVLHILAK